MANRFYIDPWGGHAEAFQQGMRGIGAVIGERRAEKKRQDLARQGQEIFATGDPDKISEFMIANPEIGENIQGAIEFKNKETERNLGQSAIDFLMGKPIEQVVADRSSFVTGQGGDPSDTMLLPEEYHQDPEGFRRNAEFIAARYAPEAYKAYRTAIGAPETAGDTTAEQKNWAVYKNLKKTDPDGAKQFGKKVGFLPKDKPLSGAAEKALIEAQDRYFALSEQSREYDVLASDFERMAGTLPSGTAMTVTEFLKRVTGSQDDASEVRRRLAKVRLSEALKYLPPGPATDRDVAEAFKGVPPENASPEQVQSFLRGAAKIARLESEFQEFKSDYISRNDNTKGMIEAWKQKIENGEVAAIEELRRPDESGDVSQYSPKDQAALDWAKANPNDPRAAAIMQRLGAQ